MLSGPDLGAGFLHQLTIDRDGEATTFTFHAQEGGADAGGPPDGSLEPLAWSRFPGMCPLGGRACFHRVFALPASDAPIVRTAYQRTRLALAAMLSQGSGRSMVPWEAGLAEWLDRVAPALGEARAPWWLDGAVAARLLGDEVPVREIVVRTSREGVRIAGDAIREYLIEPVAPTDWPEEGVVYAARAFVGTPKEGVRIGWASAPVDALGGTDRPPRTVPWRGGLVPVRPL